MKTERQRLDVALVAAGLIESREKAQRLILAGEVLLNKQIARKASQWVQPDDRLEIKVPDKFVGRGGHKLEHALREFALDVTGCVALDIGASTGGFTDCLLQYGAARVHAVDVGKGQLAQKLRHDPRVVIHDGVNARFLTSGAAGEGRSKRVIDETVDIVTVDVSFISLTLVLPPAYQLLKPGGRIVALIKPQFEAGRDQVRRGGVVRSETVRRGVNDRIRAFAEDSLQARVLGVTESPLLGPAGNHEFLICIQKP